MSDFTRGFSVRLSALGIVLAVFASSADAAKPDWAGGGKGRAGKETHAEKMDADRDRQDVAVTFGFRAEDRRVVEDYYGREKRQGKCPPGLAKKNNGCQPPGQAKQWQRGQALAADVTFYELPRELRLRLPPPPPNHRYVRVAGDILMIAIGSSMVVDAIEDILR